MVATAIKEIFVSAKDKSSAIDKVEKCYLDDEKLDFTEDDIKQLRMTCKEIISRRRELFESKGYDMPVDSSDIFIKEVIDVFDRANKTVCKDGYLDIKIANSDIKTLEKMYKEYLEDLN